MLVPFLIFSISLVSIILMLFYRVFQMRQGFIQTEGDFKEEKIWAHIETFKNSTSRHSKRIGHRLILLLLRVLIKSRYFLKKKKQILHAKIATIAQRIQKNRLQKGGGTASKFLTSIAEYKNKLKKMKEEVETEEQKNRETKEQRNKRTEKQN